MGSTDVNGTNGRMPMHYVLLLEVSIPPPWCPGVELELE